MLKQLVLGIVHTRTINTDQEKLFNFPFWSTYVDLCSNFLRRLLPFQSTCTQASITTPSGQSSTIYLPSPTTENRTMYKYISAALRDDSESCTSDWAMLAKSLCTWNTPPANYRCGSLTPKYLTLCIATSKASTAQSPSYFAAITMP